VGEDQLQLDRPGHLPLDLGGSAGVLWQRLQLKKFKKNGEVFQHVARCPLNHFLNFFKETWVELQIDYLELTTPHLTLKNGSVVGFVLKL